MLRKFFRWFDPSVACDALPARPCDSFNCVAEGKYRAPGTRRPVDPAVKEWRWFCLEHVREYNRKWNYYTCMNQKEIEEDQKADVTWQRPSWLLGMKGNYREGAFHPGHGFARAFAQKAVFEDPFDLLSDVASPRPASSLSRFTALSPESKAMKVFGLSFPWSAAMLQKRYRELVKKHHPDINGGSPEAEETIKEINEAYRVLKGI